MMHTTSKSSQISLKDGAKIKRSEIKICTFRQFDSKKNEKAYHDIYGNPSQICCCKFSKFLNLGFLLFNSWNAPKWPFTGKIGPLTLGF